MPILVAIHAVIHAAFPLLDLLLHASLIGSLIYVSRQ